jgi:hypothetical protein
MKLLKKLAFGLCGLACAALVLTGCGGSKSEVKGGDVARAKASATLEEAGTYKTKAGKPVRVFKVVLQNNAGEHLVMVVGDASVPVTMKDASTIDVGGKESSHPFSANVNLATAISAADGTKIKSVGDELGSTSYQPPAGQEGKFPMDLLKKKIKGDVLDLPSLDSL